MASPHKGPSLFPWHDFIMNDLHSCSDSCHGHHGDKCEVKVPDSPANDSAALLEEQEMTELPGTPKTPCVKLRQPKKSITDASKPRVDKHVLEVMVG